MVLEARALRLHTVYAPYQNVSPAGAPPPTAEKRTNLADLQTSLQSTLADVIPDFPLPEAPPQMQVRKRNGTLEPVDVNNIVKAVQRSSHGLAHIDDPGAGFNLNPDFGGVDRRGARVLEAGGAPAARDDPEGGCRAEYLLVLAIY